MKSMPILWKRLVKDGATCTRCGATWHELDSAVAKLRAALQPLGIEPVLEMQTIDEATFKDLPSESNRVWIAGKPIEEWLGASVGMSRCCSVCGDSDCRTLEVAGRIHETIPEELFVKAGLLAASQVLVPAQACGVSACDASAPSSCSDACS